VNNEDIIRAWKDPDYRSSLSAEEQELLPANPAGPVELDDAYLVGVTGARPCVKTTYSTYNTKGWRCL
jgi:mersacidin/lichenicidin family type 2 lantibiotic